MEEGVLEESGGGSVLEEGGGGRDLEEGGGGIVLEEGGGGSLTVTSLLGSGLLFYSAEYCRRGDCSSTLLWMSRGKISIKCCVYNTIY